MCTVYTVCAVCVHLWPKLHIIFDTGSQGPTPVRMGPWSHSSMHELEQKHGSTPATSLIQAHRVPLQYVWGLGPISVCMNWNRNMVPHQQPHIETETLDIFIGN